MPAAILAARSGRGAVWQRTWLGAKGSEVRILSPRPVSQASHDRCSAARHARSLHGSALTECVLSHIGRQPLLPSDLQARSAHSLRFRRAMTTDFQTSVLYYGASLDILRR